MSSLLERREALERRVAAGRAAELLVDDIARINPAGIPALDDQLRQAARAMVAIARQDPEFDVTITRAGHPLALRVHTLNGALTITPSTVSPLPEQDVPNVTPKADPAPAGQNSRSAAASGSATASGSASGSESVAFELADILRPSSR